MKKVYPNMDVKIYGIRNDFFGERITVTGLLTGQDIAAQLKGRELGERLYLPENLLRANTETLLDDMTVTELSEELGVPICILPPEGSDFVKMYDQTGTRGV
jgi:NifB/MoaA-like Fe-S oxidoreductase